MFLQHFDNVKLHTALHINICFCLKTKESKYFTMRRDYIKSHQITKRDTFISKTTTNHQLTHITEHGGSVVRLFCTQQKLLGSIPGLFYVLPMFAWVSSGCSGFPHHQKHEYWVYRQSVPLTEVLAKVWSSCFLFLQGENTNRNYQYPKL